MSIQRGRILRNALRTAMPDSIERAVQTFWDTEPDLAAMLRACQRPDQEPTVIAVVERLGLVENLPAAVEKARAFNAARDPVEIGRLEAAATNAKYADRRRVKKDVALDPEFDA